MQKITDERIERAWRALSGAAGDAARAASYMDGFASAQPALAELLTETFAEVGPEAADLGWFAALVVFNSLDAPAEAPPARALDAFRASEAWLAGLASADAVLVERKLRDYGRYPEPALMRYVTEAVLDAGEDGVELSPAEAERLLLALGALVRSFQD